MASEYPKIFYHPSGGRKEVTNAEQERELLLHGHGGVHNGWSERYQHQEFPKTLYHKGGASKVVASKEEQEKLGKEWGEEPLQVHLDRLEETAGQTAHATPKAKEAKAKEAA